MKKVSAIFCFLLIIAGKYLYAQDLIIVNNNTNIPCRIKSFTNDSIISYKSLQKDDPFKGYLRKPYFKEVKPNYYTNIKRNRSMNNGLGSFSAGFFYSYFPIDPVLDNVFYNDDLLRKLSNGLLFSVAFQPNLYPSFRKLESGQRFPLCMSLGFSYGFFTTKTNELYEVNYLNEYAEKNFNIKRNIHTWDIIFSLYTRKKYETHFTFKPGLQLNLNSGQIDSLPMKSKAVSTSFSFSCDQEILHLSKNLSLFLSINPFISSKKSGKLEYQSYTYYQSISYYDRVVELGIYIGFYISYFY